MGCRLRRGPGRGELASLMARSLLAVSAFGTSLHDLATLGVPVVYWTHRASDLADARRLEAAGHGALGGDGAGFSPAECEALLGRTVLDPAWRVRASAQGRALLAPADGARRIVTLMETGVPVEVGM
jgi:spore coat polysaccharide biosynthesis predicted glycosyltransferase SpsG